MSVKKRFYLLLLPVLLSGWAGPLMAQGDVSAQTGNLMAGEAGSGRTVTLQECHSAARELFAVERQMELVEQAAQTQQEILRRLITPNAMGFAMASYQSDVPDLSSAGDFGIPLSPLVKDQYRLGIHVSQALYDGGEYRAKSALAETDRLLAATEVDRHQRMLEIHVEELFFNTILLSRGLDVLGAQQDILLSRKKQLQDLFEQGKVFRVELLKIEAALLELESKVLTLGEDERKTRQMLSGLTGLIFTAEDSFLLPESEPPGPVLPDPVFEALRLKIEKTKRSEQLSRAAAMPRLYARGVGGYARPGLNILSNDFDTYWIVGLTLQVPVTGWSDHNRRSRVFGMELDQLMIQYENLRIRQEVADAGYLAEVARYDKLVQHDEQLIMTYRDIRMAYEAMLTEGVAAAADLLQALSAESQALFSKARHEVERARAAHYRNRALLQQTKDSLLWE
jgi:outer membrane protein TolC